MTLTPPTSETVYGVVTGKVILRTADTTVDVDVVPDVSPAKGVKVYITPTSNIVQTTAYKALGLIETIILTVPSDSTTGDLVDSAGNSDIYLVVGDYTVQVDATEMTETDGTVFNNSIASFTISVTTDYTISEPFNIWDGLGYAPQPGESTQLVAITQTNAVSLPAGSEPTAIISAGILTLGIPAGTNGTDGVDGVDGEQGANYLIPTNVDVTTPDGTIIGELVGYYVTASCTINTVPVNTNESVVFMWDGTSWVQPVVYGQGIVDVTVVAPVADDSADTWSWAPIPGAEMLVDGIVRTGGVYSIGNVAIESTATWNALSGYSIANESEKSRTAIFTTSVSDYQTAVLANNPLYYWAFDDAPGTTTPTNLGSGSAELTEQGAGVTFGTAENIGVGSRSLKFTSGTTGYLTAASSIIGSFAGSPFTIEAVIKPTSAGNCPIAYAYGSASLMIDMTIKRVNAQVWVPGSVFAYTANNLLTANTAMHIAMRFTGTAVEAIVNGSVLASTAASWTSYSSQDVFSVGARHDGLYGGWGGYLAGLAVHQSALSNADLLSHAQAAGLA